MIWSNALYNHYHSALEECATNHGCSDGCAIVNNTQQCFCPSGYTLNIKQCTGLWNMAIIIFILTDDIFTCLLQILMSALCLVHVNKNVLTLMGPTSAHVQKVLYLKSDNLTCQGKNYFSIN